MLRRFGRDGSQKDNLNHILINTDWLILMLQRQQVDSLTQKIFVRCHRILGRKGPENRGHANSGQHGVSIQHGSCHKTDLHVKSRESKNFCFVIMFSCRRPSDAYRWILCSVKLKHPIKTTFYFNFRCSQRLEVALKLLGREDSCDEMDISILHIPNDPLLHVFSYLDYRDLVR